MSYFWTSLGFYWTGQPEMLLSLCNVKLLYVVYQYVFNLVDAAEAKGWLLVNSNTCSRRRAVETLTCKLQNKETSIEVKHWTVVSLHGAELVGAVLVNCDLEFGEVHLQLLGQVVQYQRPEQLLRQPRVPVERPAAEASAARAAQCALSLATVARRAENYCTGDRHKAIHLK